MPIYDILRAIKDERNEGTGCTFNGFLEDYLSILEEEGQQEEIVCVFRELFRMDENLRICVNLPLNINKDVIANQIIYYKDAFKIPNGTIQCPYIIYSDSEHMQRAIMLSFGEKEAYVIAKALYFVMSEPNNEYEGSRNEIISTCVSKSFLLEEMDTLKKFLYNGEKAGVIQRILDSKVFQSYDEMYELAHSMGKRQQQNLSHILKDESFQEVNIDGLIAYWFLLKKFTYVQYMMDKKCLRQLHQGDIKVQRQAAKQACDAIPFTPYSELWKLRRNNHIK